MAVGFCIGMYGLAAAESEATLQKIDDGAHVSAACGEGTEILGTVVAFESAWPEARNVQNSVPGIWNPCDDRGFMPRENCWTWTGTAADSI